MEIRGRFFVVECHFTCLSFSVKAAVKSCEAVLSLTKKVIKLCQSTVNSICSSITKENCSVIAVRNHPEKSPAKLKNPDPLPAVNVADST